MALADAFDPPADYYSAAMGTGMTLKSQLGTIMSTNHIERSYGDFRYSAAIHDADPIVPGNILLVYNRASVPATWDGGVTWNREHIWPQSLQPGGSLGDGVRDHRADPHALRPINPSINSSRSNKAFGFEANTGINVGINANYYFPGDVDKGDVARSLFYSDTRWASLLGLSLTDDVPVNYQMGDLSSLIAWHYLDVPDEFERRRNHTIYSQAANPIYYTNNRNAFIDRPEFVWAIYVTAVTGEPNDSRITIAGTTVGTDGGSTRHVDLGRVLVGSEVPKARTFMLNKTGNGGTYYEVTSTGAATSSIGGRFHAFRMNASDHASIDVGLNTDTATAGLQSGTVTVDNLDVTIGGIGVGGTDANDRFDVSLAVLDHATPSFGTPSNITSLTHDFGTVTVGATAPSFAFDVFNLMSTSGFTADMDFDGVVTSGDADRLATDLAASAGSLSLAGGTSHAFAAVLSTAIAGSFSATYTLLFSDEDVPGAVSRSLTLTVLGRVLLAGDYNRDNVVDAADYVVWRHGLGSLYTQADYETWRTNFGLTSGGGSGATTLTAIPEPEGLVLLLVGFMTMSFRQRVGISLDRFFGTR